MSNRKRKGKGKGKRQKSARTRHVISAQRSVRLQQANHAHLTGNITFAEAEYRALINENVRTPQLYCSLAQICAQSGRRNEADGLWEKTLAIEPDFLEAQMNLADSHQLAGDIERASKIYRRVISEHKHFVIAKYMLGNILKSQGKIDEASDCYQQVMAQQPDYTQAHFTYAGIHNYEDTSDPHLQSMLELYQKSGPNAESRIHLAFALAKAFEDVGDFAKAFEYLKAGNNLRFREFNYDIESDKDLIENIMQTFSGDAISNLRVNAEVSDRPIFIVGMPRSGTSLVEKILASHSDVYGAGELDYMFALGTSRFRGDSDTFEYQPLETYAPSTFEMVGKSYLEQIALLDKQAIRVTDKMPFNMMMVGLIGISLPNAKIIHCVRDAKDTCLSIYKQNFTTGNYRFAYDMKTVAQFHNEYTKLMKHWHACMPNRIYDVSYELLTQDPEAEIRKLLAACNLDFEKNCVDFEKTKAVVKTASAFQVRQPMYTSSVGLWAKYQEFLGPMLDELSAD